VSAPSPLSLFVSHWELSASVVVPAAGAAVVYVAATRRVSRGWPARRTVSFLAGIACVLVALQSGLGAYDDQMLSVHMAQHMLLLMATPPLLLGGRPVLLALQATSPRRRAALARGLGRSRAISGPIQSLAAFGSVIVLTHLPSFYDATLTHPALHEAEHGLYLVAGLLMWSALLDGDPGPRHRLSGVGKLIYLIVAMMPMALVGAYLNRHGTLVYPAYGPPAATLGINALDNQAQAGAIMWVVGGVIMTAVGLWAVLAAMVAEERRLVAREARGSSLATPEAGPPA
jgi:putative membrane protein